MHAALRQANHRLFPQGPNGPTPWRIFDARSPITQARRDAFVASLTEHHEQHVGLGRCKYSRSNVERALIESQLLVVTRRSIPQPLNRLCAARIT